MKGCFSAILILLLSPILVASVFSSILFTHFSSEDTYSKLFHDTAIASDIQSFANLTFKDAINSNIKDSTDITSSLSFDALTTSLFNKLNISEVAPNYIKQVLQYLKGETANLNLNLTLNLTAVDFTQFKSDLGDLFVTSINKLPKCVNPSDFNNSVNSNSFPKCSPSNLSAVQEKQAFSSELDKSLKYEDIKNQLNGPVNLDQRTLDTFANIRTGYTEVKTGLLISWIVIIVLLILIILINIWGEITFAKYLFRLSLSLFISLLLAGLSLQFLILSLINFTSTNLGFSNQFSIPQGNALAKLITDLSRNILIDLYSLFYIYAGIMFGLAVIFFILNLFLRGISDNSKVKTEVDKNYYIPAFSSSHKAPSPVIEQTDAKINTSMPTYTTYSQPNSAAADSSQKLIINNFEHNYPNSDKSTITEIKASPLRSDESAISGQPIISED